MLVTLLSACATTAHQGTRYVAEANGAAERGDFARAVSLYQKAAAQEPTSLEIKRNLGMVQVRIGKYAEAEANLVAALPIAKDADTYFFLAEAQRGLAKYSESAAHYQKALGLKPNDLRIEKALAWVWLKSGSINQSFRIASQLHRLHPQDRQIKLILAKNYNHMKRYDETVRLLSSLNPAESGSSPRPTLGANADDALLLTALADAHIGKRDCAQATAMYNQVLRLRPFLPEALTGTARCDLVQGQFKRAIGRLEKAIRADPYAPEPHYFLGRAYEKSNNLKARYYYERFLRLARDNDSLIREVAATRKAIGSLERQAEAKPRSPSKM